MTTSAHHSRRFHGSTEEPTPPTCLDRDRFSLRTLHPWLYSNIPSSKPSKQKKVVRNAASPERIREWLTTNGNATAAEIGAGLRIEHSTAQAALARGCPGVGIVGERPRPLGNGKPIKLWGVVDDAQIV